MWRFMEASLSFAATDCGAMPSTVPFLDHMHGPKLTHIVFFGYYIMSDLKYLNICGWSWPFVIRLLLLFWGNLIGQTVFLLTSDKENKAAQHPGWCSAPVTLTTVGLLKVQAEKKQKKPVRPSLPLMTLNQSLIICHRKTSCETKKGWG